MDIVKRLLGYIGPYKTRFGLSFLFMFMATAAELIGPYLVKIFIDENLIPGIFPKNRILLLLSLYVFGLIGTAVFNYLQSIGFQKVALTIVRDIRNEAFQKMQKMPLSVFDKTPVGKIVSKITNDTETVKELYLQVLSVFVKNIVTLIGIYIALISLDYRMALYTLALVPLILLLIKYYLKLSKKYVRRTRAFLADINARINESVQGMFMIQLLGQIKRSRDEFEEISDKHYRASLRSIVFKSAFLRPAVRLLYGLTIFSILVYFYNVSRTAVLEIGVLYAFITYTGKFFQPIGTMMLRISQLQRSLIAAERVFSIIDTQGHEPERCKENCEITRGHIEFKKVSFSYDGKTDVLDDVSFIAESGETIAFVGQTGSGKSTIINLLMDFYNNYKGEILIDGISLKALPKDEFRKNIGLVLQDAYLFSGDIKENIIMDRKISESSLNSACKIAQVDKIVESMPQGMATKIETRGQNFSTGQRQLLTFARAIVHNPKILILDEATASVDTNTEELIQKALGEMRRGRTTLVVAHRISTIMDADTICVLNKGKIEEMGNHEALMSRKGLYYNMYRLQKGA